MNKAGIRAATVIRPWLRCLLLLARYYTYLPQHAHEVVKKVLFYDLALLIPARNCTEIDVEAFVRGRDHRSVWHGHRTRHSSSEIGNRAGPLALGEHDFVRIVDEVLVRKHLEKCNGLLFMRIHAVCGRLIGPPDDAIFGVIFPKGLQVLCVPRIIELSHILQIGCSVHSAPRVLSGRSIRFTNRSRGPHSGAVRHPSPQK